MNVTACSRCLCVRGEEQITQTLALELLHNIGVILPHSRVEWSLYPGSHDHALIPLQERTSIAWGFESSQYLTPMAKYELISETE
jgi:hypothetical protein